ncbi:uncharacterized protein [Eurosta solidaginis]|uniref:uncharacterized protein isoform X2 n=1 Tax=Eurosta solidaginis TaxID=178769 RepID=UPI003530E22B
MKTARISAALAITATTNMFQQQRRRQHCRCVDVKNQIRSLQHFRRQLRFILTSLIIIICMQGINCFQRFSEQPKYTEVNPGQDALLTCKVIDKRGTCSWQKDNKPVGIYAKKYEWAARPSSSSSGGLHLDLHPPPMQIGGDCSLWIRSATLDFDDGLWECQVTASDFTTQDALTSQPVRLVVRVAPQRPRLEYEGAHVPPGHNITIDSGALATVKCISHYGNPPATLKWYLGDQEIQPIHPQINNTEPDNPRTWSSTSVVQVTAMRERHGDILRCLAYHESYTAKSVPVEARLDVKYAPTIRLIGSPEIDLEEDKDALILRCVADANPPASIVWRRAGRSEIASLQETLQLRPVGRRDAGLYTCQAQNSVGSSEQLSVQLDVKYQPKIVSAGPDRLTTAPLFSPAAFECVAEGNPMPSYKWVQRIAHGSKFVERGSEPRLVIDNVTYDYQGEYECRATNYINGQERVAVSDPISLQVVGAPQVLRPHPSMHTISVKRGEPVSMSLVVCADPRPHRVSWEWGSLRLEAGSGTDRFRADDMLQDSREDCYLSTLHILHADEHDSRPYYLVVENERGTDRHAIHLNVEEPLEMSYLLGIAGGCLAAILILICLCIYAVRSKKCCFKGSSGYKSSDKDSEKADLKSRSDSTSGPQGDSIYTTPAGFHHHQQQQQQQQLQQHQQSQLQQQMPQQQQQQHHHLQSSAHGSPEAMKPITTTTKATTTARSLDGELLWQEEATEFIKRFPQNRRHRHGYGTLRPSASAGALHTDGTTMTTISKRASGGELLTPQQRHQRDLFSGDLGIPEVRSHVGNMVHTFETLAMHRKVADQKRNKDRAWALQQQQQWEREQLREMEKSKYIMPMRTNAIHTMTTYTTFDTPAHASYSILSKHGTSNSKYHQLKRKSKESRQRLIQLSKQQLLTAFGSNKRADKNKSGKRIERSPKIIKSTTQVISNNAQSPYADSTVNKVIMPPNDNPRKRHSLISAERSAEAPHRTLQRSKRFAQQYCHMDEDYRKTLFGTLPSNRKGAATLSSMLGCSYETRGGYENAGAQSKSVHSNLEREINVASNENDESLIVNAAFDGIFACYSDAEIDEEEREKNDINILFNNADNALQRVDLLNNEVLETQRSSHGGADSALMKLSASSIGAHKKNAPLPPTSTFAIKNCKHESLKNAAYAHLNSSKSTAPTPTSQRLNALEVEQKQQHPSALQNFIERLKATHNKVKRPFNKLPTDSLLKQDHLNIEQITQDSFNSPQLNFYREIGEGEAADERNAYNDAAADSDFLRGSTLSQSFVVHQLNHGQARRHDKACAKKKTQAPAPPPPPPTIKLPTRSVVGVNAVNGAPRPNLHLQQPQQQHQRTKSSNELLLEDLAVQARRMRHQTANRKYAAPAAPGKMHQLTPIQTLKKANEDVDELQRFQPYRPSSRGHGVGADTITARSALSESGHFLRGSAEI